MDRRAIDELRESEAGRHRGALVDDDVAENRSPAYRAREHGRALFRRDDQNGLGIGRQPAGQPIVEFEVAVRARRRGTEDLRLLGGVDEYGVQ